MRQAIIGLILITISMLALLPQLVNHLPWLKQEQQKITCHQVKIYHHATAKIETIPLEDYLVGVVAAEMPASFPIEALKAQAVAARTYTAQRLLPGGIANPVHPGADVCDDPRHGQAWLSKKQMKERWGAAHYFQNHLKITWAVQATKNKVLTYNHQLITAAYHASCGGKATENSGDVWQVNLPYLKSVPCPYCADPHPIRTVSYPLNKVAARLQTNLKAIPAAANGNNKPIKVTARTSTGRPKTLLIGQKQISATAFRDLLALRSTLFTYKLERDKITFVTKGYGHGVGMCQYGAKGMAEHQKTYQEILAHYYPGTKLTELK